MRQHPARDQLTGNELMDQTLEQWRPVVGYEGLYEVSDQGRVRSLDRLVRHSSGKALCRLRGVILKPATRQKGHLHVVLCCNGAEATHQIAHLVAAAFIGPRPDGLVVRHGKLGASNNTVGNLSYGTHSQNNGADKFRDGTHNRGERSAHARLTEDEVLEIRWLVAMGARHAAVAAAYGINRPGVTKIANRQRWAHI